MFKHICMFLFVLLTPYDVNAFKKNMHPPMPEKIRHQEDISRRKWSEHVSETSMRIPWYQENTLQSYDSPHNPFLFIFFTTVMLCAGLPDRSCYKNTAYEYDSSQDVENNTNWNNVFDILLPGGCFISCSSRGIDLEAMQHDSPYASWVLHDPFLPTDEFKKTAIYAYQEIENRCSRMAGFNITAEDTPALYTVFVDHHIKPALQSRNMVCDVPVVIGCVPENTTLLTGDVKAFSSLAWRVTSTISGCTQLPSGEVINCRPIAYEGLGRVIINEGAARFYLSKQALQGQLFDSVFHELQHIIDYKNGIEKPNEHHEVYKHLSNEQFLQLPQIDQERMADFYATIAALASKNYNTSESSISHTFITSASILGTTFTKKNIEAAISLAYAFSQWAQEDLEFFMHNEDWFISAVYLFAHNVFTCEGGCDIKTLLTWARLLYKNHKSWDDNLKTIVVRQDPPVKSIDQTHPSIAEQVAQAFNPFSLPFNKTH
ncbi:MAG: hypothetical protein US22_C0001G0019 [candidate division TM6 bacterium GW2011_GWF2_36_6]|nr:MAG: hypothetical protein US22_C0001G0019 [candidate division TM6 bacterium GW2011_GWF2_36_6]